MKIVPSVGSLIPALSLTCALASLQSAAAQGLVKDINSAPIAINRDSFPTEFVSTDSGSTYFRATWPLVGRELFVTDGMGVMLALDLMPGTESTDPRRLKWTGSRLVFATGGGYGEMYGFDPATQTAVALGTTNPSASAIMGGQLYFFGQAGYGTDVALYRSDGTAAGTTLIKALTDDRSSSGTMLAIGPVLFFGADDGINGYELWQSDGTAAGTTMVRDIRPGAYESRPSELVAMGGLAYFSANDGIHGEELWRSDGTVAGTLMVSDATPGPISSNIAGLSSIGGSLFFSASDGSTGIEPWVSDGTAAGTRLIKDIRVGTGHSSPVAFCPLGTETAFLADDGTNGQQLWVTDGTPASTRMLSGPSQVGVTGLRAREVAPLPNAVVFRATVGGMVQLWTSDGTANGVSMLADFGANQSVDSLFELTPLGSGAQVLFSVNDGVHGQEPWITDGTTAGTHLLADVNPPDPRITGDSGARPLIDAYGRTLLSAQDGINGQALWISDGSEAGTTMLAGMTPTQTYPGDATYVALLGDKVLLTAYDDVHGQELWISDGTAGGTRLLKDIDPVGSSGPSDYTVLGQVALFAANDGLRGWELWRSNGTTAGTNIVMDINPGAFSSHWREMVRAGDRAYFRADDGIHGTELWCSDGSAAGTFLVKDIQTSPQTGSVFHGLTAIRDRVFFPADDGVHGVELWVSDGTAAGTQLLIDIEPGSAGSSPDRLAAANDSLYFFANDTSRGYGLWISDGTSAGTSFLASQDLGGVSWPANFTAVGDQVFFIGRMHATGEELWVTDGTAPGTGMVKDIRPGLRHSSLGNLVATSSRKLFFSADDGVAGEELWQSDGTAAGTVLAADLNPGPDSSGPAGLRLSGGKLLLGAYSPITGRELWWFDPGASSKQVGFPSGLTRPRLEASEALIGDSWKLSIDSDLGATTGFIAFSSPATPIRLFLPGLLAQSSEIYLDLIEASAMPLVQVTTDTQGHWNRAIPVPANLHPSPPWCVQAILFNGYRWDLTNAVHFSIGH